MRSARGDATGECGRALDVTGDVTGDVTADVTGDVTRMGTCTASAAPACSCCSAAHAPLPKMWNLPPGRAGRAGSGGPGGPGEISGCVVKMPEGVEPAALRQRRLRSSVSLTPHPPPTL